MDWENSHPVLTVTIGCLLMFGAMLIPVIYLVCTRFRGSVTRRMIKGLLVQLVCTLAVGLLVVWVISSGNPDGQYLSVLMYPVNLVGFLYYVSALMRRFRGSGVEP